MIGKILKIAGFQEGAQDRKAKLYRNLMRHEARIGGGVFGPVPDGVRREFFCLDKHTWVWHEEWTDKSGKRQIRTTRYDVRPNGIVKAQDGQHYQVVSDSEAFRLLDAAREYQKRVNKELYKAFVA